ncbi:hypothetical protein ITP53_11630 [Nonomuraea sp. K274]|uniref:Arylsulfatase n=1 Tax=Nonomuraea cypriaca TaxID=1187855 RepID=A0A931A4Y6_9ACTN|nr:hypothetical protein [Nonomuraea cypriaca]
MATAANGHIPRDRPIDGVDLTPALLGRPARHRTLYHYHHWTLNAVRSGPWKLHLPERENGLWEGDDIGQVEPEEDRGKPLLYNIEKDKGERHNLADRYPDKVPELTRLAERFDEEIQAQKSEALKRAGG